MRNKGQNEKAKKQKKKERLDEKASKQKKNKRLD